MDIETIYSGMVGMGIGYIVGKTIWKSHMKKSISNLLKACKITGRTYLNEGYDLGGDNNSRKSDYDEMRTIYESIKKRDSKADIGPIHATRSDIIRKIEGSFPEGNVPKRAKKFDEHRDYIRGDSKAK